MNSRRTAGRIQSTGLVVSLLLFAVAGSWHAHAALTRPPDHRVLDAVQPSGSGASPCVACSLSQLSSTAVDRLAPIGDANTAVDRVIVPSRAVRNPLSCGARLSRAPPDAL